jgi:histone arginine demethylase JMJD6
MASVATPRHLASKALLDLPAVGSVFPSPVPRLSASEAKHISVHAFATQFEGSGCQTGRQGKPCVIGGLLSEWPAIHDGLWDFDQLEANCGDAIFSCGTSNATGEPVLVQMSAFLRYVLGDEVINEADHQHHDGLDGREAAELDKNPLYLFDECFEESCPRLLDEYSVPRLFSVDASLPNHGGDGVLGVSAVACRDLLSLMDDSDVSTTSSRLDYRWLLIGPPRSGSMVHVDPMGTAAWNALVVGRKRWLLFSPDTPSHVFERPQQSDAAADPGSGSNVLEFFETLPALRDSIEAASNSADPNPLVPRIYDFNQLPGEVVFVPAGE